jgi:predicted ester cyclase
MPPHPCIWRAWRRFTAPFVEAFPDLRLTVQDIAAEGDTVAARVAFRGAHRGEFQGLPPTGKQVAFSSMEFNRVVGGQVEEHWVEINLLGLVWQLGVATIPGPRLLIRILVRQAEKLRSRLSTGR